MQETEVTTEVTPQAVETVEASSVTEKEPEVWTPRKIREYMRLYFTVRHPRVKHCQHKLVLTSDPRHNCEWCWFSYFRYQGELVQTADECFVKEGRKMLERVRGKRFVKFFIRFMSTLARMRDEAQAEEAAKGNNGDNSGQGQTGEGQAGGDSGGVVRTVSDAGSQVEGTEVSDGRSGQAVRPEGLDNQDEQEARPDNAVNLDGPANV